MSPFLNIYLMHGVPGLVLLCIHRLRSKRVDFVGPAADHERRTRHSLLDCFALLRDSCPASSDPVAVRSHTAGFILGRSASAPPRLYDIHVLSQIHMLFLTWVLALHNLQPDFPDEVDDIWFESMISDLTQWAAAMRFLDSALHWDWAMRCYRKCFDNCDEAKN
jgi:hypothetical protein